jgi:hypothetical protein
MELSGKDDDTIATSPRPFTHVVLVFSVPHDVMADGLRNSPVLQPTLKQAKAWPSRRSQMFSARRF